MSAFDEHHSNGRRAAASSAEGDAGRSGDPRRTLGSRAEEICARRLMLHGWRILDRNWRVRMGEIDIVAMDSSTLVIVEVKAHNSANLAGPTSPALAVGLQKQRRLRRLASAWLITGRNGRAFKELRFDVVGITFAPDGSVARYEHIRDAF
jgi:putative endonuclease